ncbi:hypothetical protein QL285_057444 [Trifolium repens]|nr:hypothetical protein QL285_057444 [Trifolium repens]
MKRKTKEEIIQVKTPLLQVYEKYFWCDGFPTISEHDNEEVIKNFLESVRRDTGVSVPRKMVVSVPNWDIFKGPRDITRNRRKPRTTEQEMIDEGSDDQEHASADETEEGAEGMMTEAVQKEKRTKKRHDRPSASEEDQNPAKPAKRLKTRASKPKGKISESNTSSIPVAQVIGSEPQPSIAKSSISQPPLSTNQPQPIDFTVPISVVLPDHKAISSSSSSDTSTASDELIATLIRESNPKQKKTLTPKRTSFKKTTKKTTIKPIHLSSDEEPTINVDTTILNQSTNQGSVIEHLEQHMCGVAFTNSNPNSPHQFPSMNLTNDSPVHKTQNTQVIHTPPPSLDHISRVNPPTFTPVQNEPFAHSEEQQKSPHSSPINVMTEQQHQSPQPVPDPLNRPLVLEEVLELYQHLTKAEHQIFKDSINLDDDIIPPNLSKIKIIELKRKEPEPTIPFDPSLSFFNSDSEPNLEMLNNAIGIRLKRFKQREEEALIFPSDMDAEVRELEYLFGKSLRILSTHLKDKIKGRGANTVRELFEIAERTCAPRLTFFNHEEECQRLAFLAAVDESMRRSFDEEQARIAAEMEHQRLAEQEALNLLVDRAVHIATIETNKIFENQRAAEDTVMNDQNLSKPDSDKGKTPIVASSPPRSPPVLVQGSSSSAIPSVMQEALDVIKHDIREELRNEMDEFRADIREDMNRSGEATNKKIDAMMELLLKLTQQQPKP